MNKWKDETAKVFLETTKFGAPEQYGCMRNTQFNAKVSSIICKRVNWDKLEFFSSQNSAWKNGSKGEMRN